MSTRIFNSNFVDTDLVSNLSFSSEQSAFPVTNLFNKQRRSKVWRSNGYWDITSTINTIVFRETIATDLIATVTVAEYNSSTALYAAIKAALEAVGSSTYTVESDATTLKTKFTSNGAGGGGIFEIDWITSTLATTLGFLATEEDTGALSYLADSLVIHTSEFIQWDFGISSDPTAFFAIGPRNQPIKLSPSATLTLQGNETDAWITSVNTSLALSYDSSVISTINPDGLYSEALRYSRFSINDPENSNGYVELGAIFLGTFFEAVRGAVQFPFRGQYVDRSNTVFSEGGQTFSDIREKTERFQIRWFGLTVADKENIDEIFDDFGTSIPMFVQFDANLSFSSIASKYIRYVKFAREPEYELVSPGNYAASMEMREEL
jgi:hypothetical protein